MDPTSLSIRTTMRFSVLLAVALTCLSVQASWFGSDLEYTSWDSKQLVQWLEQHDIKVPKSYNHDQLQNLVKENWGLSQSWTRDQYHNAQKSFQNIKDSTFDSWEESRLREWLLEQGIVAPSGPRERLLLLAKQQYKAYTDTASSLSNTASSVAYDTASSASSLIAIAADEVSRKLDDSKDYVYSTWDESQLRNWLVSRGALKSHEQKSREEMLKLMRDYYAKATEPVWDAWSDSYTHEWLVGRGLIKSDYEKNRDHLVSQMQKYYYDVSDRVWITWSDSDLKQWLVDHNIIKSNAQLQRGKLLILVSDNYSHASDTFWSAWSDSDIRAWLINHGYLKSDAKTRRDELVKMINEKYKDYASRSAAYLSWPDARLRAYLRSHGLSEEELPTSRPGLLQEVRIRYVQSMNSAQALLNKILEMINSGIEAAEDVIGRMFELISGKCRRIKDDAEELYEKGKQYGKEKYEKEKEHGQEEWEDVWKKSEL